MSDETKEQDTPKPPAMVQVDDLKGDGFGQYRHSVQGLPDGTCVTTEDVAAHMAANDPARFKIIGPAEKLKLRSVAPDAGQYVSGSDFGAAPARATTHEE